MTEQPIRQVCVLNSNPECNTATLNTFEKIGSNTPFMTPLHHGSEDVYDFRLRIYHDTQQGTASLFLQ